jgi:hypothetical protein
MGGESPPPAPAPPQAPNYAAANREAVQADIDTLGTRKRIEQAAKLGSSVFDPDTGKTYDFTGLGDAQLGLSQANIDRQTADINAQSQLDIANKYGDQFQDLANKAIQRADPTQYEARQQLGRSAIDDAALGSTLGANESKQVEDQIRSAQLARGNYRGNAPISQEVLAKFDTGQKLKQQRLSNLSSYVFGSPLTAQYQSISGAQQGAAPFLPVQYQPGLGLNPNAGAQGAQFASNIYGTQAGIYGTQSSNYNQALGRPNQTMQLVGTGVGLLSSAAAAY